MPGIDDVDRQFRPRRDERGELTAAELAMAAVGFAPVRKISVEELREAYPDPDQSPGSHPLPGTLARREVRRQALTLAAQVLPETPAAALADDMPIEAVTLRIARAFERYLLGDDPPKPPAKME